jgi:hypothetical protein
LSAENEGDEHASIFLSANNTLYWPAVDYTVNAFRAYFITAGKGVYKVKRGMPIRMVEQPKVPTAIENTNAHLNTEKRLENGQVIIIRNGVKYTIQGQKIQ